MSTTLFRPVIYVSAYKKEKKPQQNPFHKRKFESLARIILLGFFTLTSGSWIPFLTKVFLLFALRGILSEKEKNNKFHFSFKLSVTNTL